MDDNSQCLNILGDTKGKVSNKQLKFYLVNKKQDRYIIDAALLADHLEDEKFRTLNLYGNVLIVKVENNIVEVYTSQEVFNYVLDQIRNEDNNKLRSDFINQGERLLMKNKALLGSLKSLELKPYKDDISTSRHFYNNCIAKVTAEGIETISYYEFSKGEKYILKEKIINRPFKNNNTIVSDFESFLKLATNSLEHFESVCNCIGYLLCGYKNPANAKAIIISDLLSQATNEANGRSGKGLIIKAIDQLINVVEYNGKNLDLKRDKFVYQSIDFLTALFVIQDISRSFDFEDLFSQITDKMDIQRKHAQKIILDFSDSPKIAITANYTIPQNTDSFSDRKHMVILNNYFNANNKPEKEFKKLFFVQWDEKEFLAFDNFMMRCVQSFLKNGLTDYDDPELRKQNLINNTSKHFVELMESKYSLLNEYYLLKDIADELDINTSEPSVKSRITMQWISTYANHQNLKIDKRQSGGIVKFCLTK
jgi:hypothetical protein